MGIYATLGVSLTIAFFTSGATIGLLTQSASKALHRRAIASVMRAPMSFFETTPLGRIMNRFSKDIDTIDNTVSDSLRMFLMTSSNIVGAFVLIGVINPWFLKAVAAIMVFQCITGLARGNSSGRMLSSGLRCMPISRNHSPAWPLSGRMMKPKGSEGKVRTG